jgi:hypothetical protein
LAWSNALAYYEREGFTRWVFGREATEQTERKLEARGRCYKTFSASPTLLTNNTECHYAECTHAECTHAECRYAECHYAECHLC